jgi:hypothetical protein
MVSMGLDSTAIQFLCSAKCAGVDFSDTLMVGRQSFYMHPKVLQRVLSRLGSATDARGFLRENQWGEAFFKLLGAHRISSLDVSDFEGATIIADLNSPIPDHLSEGFSVVFDGGTLEHIFEITVALKSCMQMVRVGGHFIQVTGANNFAGHGFWQFSAELIYRVFAPENGYQVEAVLMHENTPGGAWYSVQDPKEVHDRVELCNSTPTYILTIAKRISTTEIFVRPPQQSDYVFAWAGQTRAPHKKRLQRLNELRRRFIPKPIRRSVKLVWDLLRAPFRRPRAPFDRPYYRRVSERDLLNGRLKGRKYQSS